MSEPRQTLRHHPGDQLSRGRPGKVELHLAGDAWADGLLSHDPLALFIGMVLDQQVPLERAFSAPAMLAERIGSLDAAAIAGMDPQHLGAAFTAKPALNRYPGTMATRVQALGRLVVDEYGGRPERIWLPHRPGRSSWRACASYRTSATRRACCVNDRWQ